MHSTRLGPEGTLARAVFRLFPEDPATCGLSGHGHGDAFREVSDEGLGREEAWQGEGAPVIRSPMTGKAGAAGGAVGAGRPCH